MKTKKVPKGTSEYQASWIVPEHDEDSEDNDFTDEDEEDEDGDHQMFGFDEEDDSQSEVSLCFMLHHLSHNFPVQNQQCKQHICI